MSFALTASSIDFFIRLGRFEVYAHGPSIPSGWQPGDTTGKGETIFRVFGATVYLVNHHRHHHHHHH